MGPTSLSSPTAPSALRVPVTGPGRLIAGGIAVAALALSLARFGVGFVGFEVAFVSVVLVALAAVDLDRHLLPNRIVVPAGALLAAEALVRDPGAGVGRLAWGAGVFAAFLVFALVYPAGLGMGDVKLVLFLGLALGSTVIAALMVGLFAAALLSLAVLARYGAGGRKVAIPLGAFLCFGGLAVLLTAGPG